MNRVVVLTITFAVASACATKSFDLGHNDPAVLPNNVPDAAVPAPRIYGCVDWNDDEVLATRGAACANACPVDTDAGEHFAVRTQKDVVAVTANRWIFCGAHPFANVPEALGIEFTPGCRVYLLRRDGEGNLVRGTEARHQASFDIYVPSGGDAASGPLVDLHVTTTQTLRYSVDSAKCPTNWLKLRGEEGTGEILLRPVDAKDLVQPPF